MGGGGGGAGVRGSGARGVRRGAGAGGRCQGAEGVIQGSRNRVPFKGLGFRVYFKVHAGAW